MERPLNRGQPQPALEIVCLSGTGDHEQSFSPTVHNVQYRTEKGGG
jgi:hypothetical protein